MMGVSHESKLVVSRLDRLWTARDRGVRQRGGSLPTQVVEAVGWGPLTPVYDGSARAWSQGEFQNRGSAYSNVTGTYRDLQADGNTVYVNSDIQFLTPSATDGSLQWQSYATLSTPEIGTADGVKPIGDLYTSFRSDSSKARAVVGGCAQFGWPVPDPCERAYPSFSY